jgi:DNA modification methylase
MIMQPGDARLIRANALDLPLPDESVDLIVTSPPYFALRAYQDGGETYDGQLGAEATPEEFVDALVAATAEMVRVLKPSGSIWVNLGDKYAGSNGRPGASATSTIASTKRAHEAATGRLPTTTVRPKSLIGIPWRYAIRCIDELGLILRAEVIWSKPNGLPESVTDRVARKHEQWFHFTKEPSYFAAVDEIREPYKTVAPGTKSTGGVVIDATMSGHMNGAAHTLGKLPGSVWTVATEPLKVPAELGVNHFAAFPTEWPRRIILGWSPAGVCEACGEPRRPVVDKDTSISKAAVASDGDAPDNNWGGGRDFFLAPKYTITHYACSCPDTSAPTRPAVVLDPFAGTGTTVAVAKALGRIGIGTDLSADYLRLADWRCNGDGYTKVETKVIERTYGKQSKKSKRKHLDNAA